MSGSSAPIGHGEVSSAYGGGASTGCEMAMAPLSATTAVVCANNCGAHYCSGLSFSGTTLTIGTSMSAGESSRADAVMGRVDDTRAIYCVFSSANSYTMACMMIKHSPSDNTLTKGSVALSPQSSSGQHFRPKGMTMLSATTGLVTISGYGHLDYNGAVVEVTGDMSLSVVRTGNIADASTYSPMVQKVARVDDNTVVNCFNDQRSSGGGTFCVVVDVSSNGFSTGTYLRLENRGHGNNGMDITGIGSGIAIVCWRGTAVVSSSGGGYGGHCMALKADGTSLRPSSLSGTVSQFLNGADGAGGDAQSQTLYSLGTNPSDHALYCYMVSSSGPSRCSVLTLS